jgi:hypothetical protein
MHISYYLLESGESKENRLLFCDEHLSVQLINQTIVKVVWTCSRTLIETHYCQWEPLPATKASSGKVAITKSCEVQHNKSDLLTGTTDPHLPF